MKIFNRKQTHGHTQLNSPTQANAYISTAKKNEHRTSYRTQEYKYICMDFVFLHFRTFHSQLYVRTNGVLIYHKEPSIRIYAYVFMGGCVYI